MRKVNKMRYKQHVGHNFEALLLYRLADRECLFLNRTDRDRRHVLVMRNIKKRL